MTSPFERHYTANAIRGIRKILHQGRSYPLSPEIQWNDQESNVIEYGLWIAYFLLFVLAFCMIAGCNDPALSAEIPQDKAIKCLIGEAENQGFIGIIAVAHALRNRGTLKGCYGLSSPRVIHHLYSQKIYNLAKLAWERSANEYDLTGGAHGWGNPQDLQSFAKCKWWKNCRVTFIYRDHYFYRKVI